MFFPTEGKVAVVGGFRSRLIASNSVVSRLSVEFSIIPLTLDSHYEVVVLRPRLKTFRHNLHWRSSVWVLGLDKYLLTASLGRGGVCCKLLVGNLNEALKDIPVPEDLLHVLKSIALRCSSNPNSVCFYDEGDGVVLR
jgi:hypothetical protein